MTLGRPVVLVGAAGTATAFGAVSSLRRHFGQDVAIVAMDTNPPHLVTNSLLADAFETVPFSAAPEFPAALKHVVSRHRVTTYLPLVDEEIAVASELAAGGQLPGVHLIAPPPATARICLDKWLTAQWMHEHGIPTPMTYLASDGLPPGQYFFKPRNGFGSRGTGVMTAQDIARMSSADRSGAIVQRICRPPEVTVDAFVAPTLKFWRVACRERLEAKSGVCTKARVSHNDEFEALAVRLATELPMAGAFCFQAMRDGDRWAITDVNARCGGGTAMTAAAGLDFFAAAFALAWDQDPRPLLPQIERDVFVTRQYTEFVMTA